MYYARKASDLIDTRWYSRKLLKDCLRTRLDTATVFAASLELKDSRNKMTQQHAYLMKGR